MAVALKQLTLRIQVSGKLQNPLSLSTPVDSINKEYSISFTNGTGVNQAHNWWHASRTLAGATTEDLDLSGTLTPAGAFGNVVFTHIKAILIAHMTPTATGNLTIGGDANGLVGWVGAATHTVIVGPGGMQFIVNPTSTAYAVTAGTGDILQVANADAAAITYEIFLLGRTS